MRRLVSSAITATLLISMSPAFAEDVTDTFLRCATTKDDRQRLSCYDAIGAKFTKQAPQQPQAAGADYQTMALADLKTDLKQLMGKKVAAKGKIQVVGDLSMVMFKTDEFDLAPVSLNAESLPRDDRKKLLNSCQMVLCTATVQGTIKKGMVGPTLFAERVSW